MKKRHRVIAATFAHAREFALSQGWRQPDWSYVHEPTSLYGLERGTVLFVVVGASRHPKFSEMMEIAETRQYVVERRSML
jgi:hypothetical protein